MEIKYRRSVLIGTLLGDANFFGKKNKGVMFGHCAKQYEYGQWKLSVISRGFKIGSKECLAKSMTSPSGNRTAFYKFWTTSSYKITAIHKRMVVNGKKDITEYALKHMGVIGLAILFMDDGCKETNKGKIRAFKISLGGFRKESVDRFALHIKAEYDIDSKVYLEHGQYPCIKFTTQRNRDMFVNLIKPYLHQSMLYKIQF